MTASLAGFIEETSQAQWLREIRRHKDRGHLPGINETPGAEDDGWITPPPAVLSDGSTVQLFKDGQALAAAYRAIEQARRRVCLEVYIFHSDDTGKAFAKLMCEKARAGVGVYLIYDSFGSFRTDPAVFEQMRRAGVRVSEFHPIKPWRNQFSWRPFNRDHRKLLVVDHHIAWLGGLNIGAEYAGSWVVSAGSGDCPWRDNAVGIVGPATKGLMAAFTRTWRYVHNGGRMRNCELLHLDDQTELGILAAVPTRSSPLVQLRQFIEKAKKSIHLTMAYFAPPEELIEALIKARRRGVRVRLMLPSKCDVKALLIAARSFYDRLLAAGIEIYERQDVILHAKTMTIDGEITILGSTNLDYRSIEFNLELSIVLRNADFARQIEELFENDVYFSRRITPKEWRKRPRPLADRVIQWAVDRARYLL